MITLVRRFWKSYTFRYEFPVCPAAIYQFYWNILLKIHLQMHHVVCVRFSFLSLYLPSFFLSISIVYKFPGHCFTLYVPMTGKQKPKSIITLVGNSCIQWLVWRNICKESSKHIPSVLIFQQNLLPIHEMWSNHLQHLKGGYQFLAGG